VIGCIVCSVGSAGRRGEGRGAHRALCGEKEESYARSAAGSLFGVRRSIGSSQIAVTRGGAAFGARRGGEGGVVL